MDDKMNGNQPPDQNQMNEGNNNQREGHAISQQQKRPWYSRGWVWMIIVALAFLALLVAFSWIADQLGNIGQSIDEQTEAIREQTGFIEEQNTILQDIRESINQIVMAIRDGINRILGLISEQ